MDGSSSPPLKKRRKQYLISSHSKVPRQTFFNWRKSTSEGSSVEGNGLHDAVFSGALDRPTDDLPDISDDPVPVPDLDNVQPGPSMIDASVGPDETPVEFAFSQHSVRSSDESEVDKPLYTGSDISVGQCVFFILSFFLKHALNKEALKGLLELIALILPSPNHFPATLYHLNTVISNLSYAKCAEKKHFYCEICSFYIGEMPSSPEGTVPNQLFCPNCSVAQSLPGVFVEFPLESVLRTLFETRGLFKFYENNTDRRGIMGCGKEYLDLRKNVLSNKYDVTLAWNTDGVPVFKSSNIQLRPLQITVLEVPPTLRNIFVTICGLWIGSCKPNMNTFLRPFCHSLRNLFETGFKWIHPISNEEITSRVTAPLAVLDAPARASVLNMNQYNGKYGCPTCKAKGDVVKRGKGKARIYRDIDSPMRSDEETRYLAQRAVALGKPVFGIKGPTWAGTIPHLNLASSFSPDYMHCVLLGVVRHFLFLWLDTCHHMQRWYLGKNTAALDQKILSIRPPSNVQRLPRSFKTRKLWKASEYRSWLLFYSIPVLNGIMKEKYLQHWMLLVHSIYILLKENIEDSELDAAHVLLQLFVFETADLYPEEITYTFNLHQLLHLSIFTRNWGPLWISSAFSFEFNNGLLLRLIHGSQSVSSQLVNTLRLMNGMWFLATKYTTSSVTNRATVLGREVEKETLPASLISHPAILSYQALKFGVFQRVRIFNSVYTSRIYTRQIKSINYCVCLKGNYRFGLIECFLQKEETILCVIRALQETSSQFVHRATGTQVTHIVPVVESDIVFVTPFTNVSSKAIYVSTGSFVCIQPNHVETQL